MRLAYQRPQTGQYPTPCWKGINLYRFWIEDVSERAPSIATRSVVSTIGLVDTILSLFLLSGSGANMSG